MFPDFVLTPYVQAGAGVELARVDLAGGRTERVYPLGFIGLGAELKLGVNFRMLAAAQAEPAAHGSAHGVSGAEPPPAADGEGVPMRFGLSAQGRVLARYAL